MRGQIGIIVHGLPVTWESTDVMTMLASWPFHEAVRSIKFYDDAELFDVLVFAPRDLRVVEPGPCSAINLWIEVQLGMSGVRTEILQRLITILLDQFKDWLACHTDLLPPVQSITVVLPSRELHTTWRSINEP